MVDFFEEDLFFLKGEAKGVLHSLPLRGVPTDPDEPNDLSLVIEDGRFDGFINAEGPVRPFGAFLEADGDEAFHGRLVALAASRGQLGGKELVVGPADDVLRRQSGHFFKSFVHDEVAPRNVLEIDDVRDGIEEGSEADVDRPFGLSSRRPGFSFVGALKGPLDALEF
jgi:hypothetical protein